MDEGRRASKRQMGTMRDGSNTSALILTNGIVTEKDEYDTSTDYETRGINDQVSQ